LATAQFFRTERTRIGTRGTAPPSPSRDLRPLLAVDHKWPNLIQ